MEKKKKFRLFDAILGTVCLTLVCESVMPTAAIGNTQYAWWILLLIGFCLPYGMITAELGTTYPSEGGMYDWVKRAFGPKWAGRVAWNYWVNFPLWIASLAVAVTDIICGMFNVELNIWLILLIQLAYIWLVTFLSTKRIGESKGVVNLGTAFKVFLLLGIGILGIYTVIKTGESANPITSFKDLIPDFSLNIDTGLPFISIILFNFMGFEVVGTWVDDMDNPKKDIPKALIFGGLLMAIFYILPATGFNIALSPDVVGEMDPENVVEVLTALFAAVGIGASALKVLVIIAGFMFIYTFIANIASWSFGVNSVAKYAADDGSMPKMFSKTNEEGVAVNGAIINGVVASLIVIGGVVASLISEDFEAGFSLFFCLSWITLLVGYIPMFMAFLKLRKTDANVERPYKVPGGKFMIKVAAIVPFIILILGVVFTLFGDFSLEYIQDNIPLLAGVVLSFIIEEILVARIKSKK
ncbi:MAG: amino acid permease [Bacilli bacterium]|nr:amino acid permease [Bacilli bacterium]